MYIPFVTSRSQGVKALQKRKGGGGGGGRGGGSTGGSKTGSTGGSGSGGSKSSTSSDRPPPYSPGSPPPAYSVSGGNAVRGSTASTGGGRSYTVASGSAFAGATAGGGTRAQVYGGRGYGAVGYAPYFPFMFWPLYFPVYPYYYGSSIYGPSDNTSRPGGDMQSYTLLPSWGTNTTASTNGQAAPANNAFAVYGDASSVQDLVPIIAGTCDVTFNVYGQNYSATPFNAVQFYRGSTFALTLDGYNNSLPDIEVQDPSQNFTQPSQQPAPLPAGVNTTYFDCLNTTIGSYIGLIDSDYATNAGMKQLSSTSLTASAALIAMLLNWLL